MKPQDYEKLIMENITKMCQEESERLEKTINMEAKNIAKSNKFAEKIDHPAKTETFITFKRSQR